MVKSQGIFVIKAVSAGYYSGNTAEITVNHQKIEIEPNENGHFRGLHIVVINPNTQKVELAKAFDTHDSPKSFDAFITQDLLQGHIVVAACKDDCVSNLSASGKRWFSDMGSVAITDLKPSQGFAFISITGIR